jgi:putative FmdB family regulatory protein
MKGTAVLSALQPAAAGKVSRTRRHDAAPLMWHFALMPIYVYELCEGECKTCGGTFELRQPLNREPCKACPLCKKPVRRIITGVNSPKLTKPLSTAEAKNAGFKIYKRVGKGEYERQ